MLVKCVQIAIRFNLVERNWHWAQGESFVVRSIR
jgi:hypothetical protein